MMPDLEVLLSYQNLGPEHSHSLTAHGGLPKIGHHRVLHKKALFTALTPAVERLLAHADNCLDFSRHQLSAPSTTAALLGVILEAPSTWRVLLHSIAVHLFAWRIRLHVPDMS